MIYIFLADGFEEIEALAPLDLLRRAGLKCTTVGIGGREIAGAHGIEVKADIACSDFSGDDMEMIMLPGGMPGTKNLDASNTVHGAIDKALEAGAFISAICAAPMILGKRGLLAGKRATCFPGFEGYLEGAEISEKRVVRDGKIITGAGMGVAIPFGLALVEALLGKETAEKLSRSTLYT